MLSYTPCLLMKPALRLRLHDTQSQPCFPAASNALALPVGNLIFAAMPTERITHYTLQAKSCAKGIPFGNPFLSECVATLPPKCKISGIGQPVPGADLYRLFAYMGFLLYRPYKPFQFITSVCIVALILTANFPHDFGKSLVFPRSISVYQIPIEPLPAYTQHFTAKCNSSFLLAVFCF